MNIFKIETGPAPKTIKRGGKGKWQQLFSEAQVGHWVTIPAKDRDKANQAGNRYRKGGYSLQKLEEGDDYILEFKQWKP
tara:strand:+ start:2315 stop:2551 length:237 start_codon:yes stop_codon:yes gene_type:complete